MRAGVTGDLQDYVSSSRIKRERKNPVTSAAKQYEIL